MENDFYNDRAKELMGIAHLYPYQRLVVHHLLAVQGYWGEELASETPDINLVILPTGSGKSICFMLPGMILEGITVVVYPLLSLMEDQLRRLMQRKVSAASYKGGMTGIEKDELGNLIEQKKIKFLLTNPEMCRTERFRSWASKNYFNQLIVDEVHTVLQWGKTFRPSLLEIENLINPNWFKGFHFFTATLSEPGEKELKQRILPHKEWNVIRSCSDRSNIRYYFVTVSSIAGSLREICADRKGATLIFCASRKSAEETARYLRWKLKEEEIDFYHAGLSKEQKKYREEWFFQSKQGILCSTTAYGMGVDKPDIRLVVHKDPPSSVESYLQEAGRAGRDREMADSIVLVSSSISRDHFIHRINHRDGCRRYSIMNLMGETMDHCGGCDYCTPRQWNHQQEKGMLKILDRALQYSGIMGYLEIIDFLEGLHTPTIMSKHLHQLHGFGCMSEVSRDNIMHHLKTLIARGLLRFPSKGLWKGRIIKGKILNKKLE